MACQNEPVALACRLVKDSGVVCAQDGEILTILARPADPVNPDAWRETVALFPKPQGASSLQACPDAPDSDQCVVVAGDGSDGAYGGSSTNEGLQLGESAGAVNHVAAEKDDSGPGLFDGLQDLTRNVPGVAVEVQIADVEHARSFCGVRKVDTPNFQVVIGPDFESRHFSSSSYQMTMAMQPSAQDRTKP
jgi:hypothetical protein